MGVERIRPGSLASLRGLGRAAVLLMLPGLAAAEPTAPVTAVWDEWTETHDIGRSTMAVVSGGDLLTEEGRGTDASMPVPVASLSKTITAACVAQLVAAGRMTYEQTVGDVLPAGGTVSDRTVAELLTHSGGIAPDDTQNSERLAGAEPGVQMADAVAATSANRESQDGPRGQHFYNNENYAFLGLMIEKVTGKTYYRACSDAVLAPAAVLGGTLDGRWGAHGPWGGWSLTAADYARFFDSALSGTGPLSSPPEELPSVPVDRSEGPNYGMGTLWSPLQNGPGHVVWNLGQLCWKDDGDGAYVARYGQDGPTVVVTWSGCLDGRAIEELDAALARSVRERAGDHEGSPDKDTPSQ